MNMNRHIEYKLELAQQLKAKLDDEVRKPLSDREYVVAKQQQQYWTGKVDALEEVLKCLADTSK